MKADQITLTLRIVIENPVPGVLHSLQSKSDQPLDPKVSRSGEQLTFECPIRVGPGPKFFGDQVRREGPERRFVYIRIGTMAGDPASPLTRRMKIDIHDIDPALLNADAIIETRIDGTGKDGSPACATIKPISRRAVAA